MKFAVACAALFATTALAMPGSNGHSADKSDTPTCDSHQTVVCDGGNGGLISLGNILTGLLGESCAGGDVYCCSESDVQQKGLINLDLNLQCSLNHLL
ncbi:uncharacterized protein N7459_003349 [Penicillium hispanicum]|uniref:uncharacterized protein n=1 Tax=Penicillium hispanicum TaxID=1080232 RepID=UPI002541E3EF|nr:uncharacterized protein N7459_003349 [Penicillium hispanicum]KAJ5587584.1 hypothetical protein N7459_003349 [Penicillium hispanicum]